MTLPSQEDFSAFPGTLDEMTAWNNFGNKSLEEAYNIFCKNPEYYQEDFMFMGWKAFLFYFPVIEKYIKEVEIIEDYDDYQFYILGEVIKSQIASQKLENPLLNKIIDLSDVVLEKTQKSILCASDKKCIISSWQKLKNKLINRI